MSVSYNSLGRENSLVPQIKTPLATAVKVFARVTNEIKDRHTVEGEELTVFMAPSKKLQVICVVVIIP